MGFSSSLTSPNSDRNGEVIFKDTFSSAVAAIVVADYRMDGREEVICCAHSGDVRGYLPSNSEAKVVDGAV